MMTEQLKYLNTKDINPNPYQPRLQFKTKELEELAQSIKENGLIQPIIVRKSDIFGYDLVAGERRLKAAKLAGLNKIPVIIKKISDDDSMKQAIIENLQRSDLNPIEEAKAYQNLINRNHMTHDDIAKVIGKSRPYITNSIRLLNLPLHISQALEKGLISQGHARLLLSIEKQDLQDKWFQKILTEQLSVHQIERALKSQTKKEKKTSKDIFLAEKEKELSQSLGLPVVIHYNKKHQGQLKISFSSEEDFNRLMNKLN
ncbi:ParB/RepB/Spo0J family partition protein [Streptococcus mutans]|jgi:chromosome segregation DNA-binding protein|uniref:SpoJ n=2 Tax=Streptococcus mutans TaxID=1309 RepID=Q8DRQ5_STRMU|nr:ParB/RepB/Spo0J family partition protein [Streptococcus mutans]AAN59753.1 putative SpoJ [Streptococcus mutans UA159]AJD56342.1 SpoJ [Streptococcus mutans UA159-FR]MCB4954043.1 ParB/RepB/Spo0J family partition protein [Streptococcus mutans]MCB5055152.1 ParB/RepB/Spo0J family partition protein [Streptococcus mutans]NLQ46471.1 ParB/RepB/Spo0J family partition protein [Streptococcus mutans]